MQAYALGAEACVVASVVSTRQHPSRTGLRLVTVDRGGAQQEVVCGAPNVPEPGGLVVLAPLGAHLPAKGMTIEKRTVAGVPSEGMLCSEAELGLTEDEEGILVLPAGTAAPGSPSSPRRSPRLATPFSRFRSRRTAPIASGTSASLARRPPSWVSRSSPPLRRSPDGTSRRLRFLVLRQCDHRGPRALRPLRCCRPSGHACRTLPARPALASGVARRPPHLRTVVDITNLVMLEYGHPIHSFDLDRVRGSTIVVRRARAGEKLLHPGRCRSGARPGRPRDLRRRGARRTGGGHAARHSSEITAETRRVLIECAYFDPRAVRRSARRHGLHTESSHRFERGASTGGTRRRYSFARTSSMGAELAGAGCGAGAARRRGAAARPTDGPAPPRTLTATASRHGRAKARKRLAASCCAWGSLPAEGRPGARGMGGAGASGPDVSRARST